MFDDVVYGFLEMICIRNVKGFEGMEWNGKGVFDSNVMVYFSRNLEI